MLSRYFSSLFVLVAVASHAAAAPLALEWAVTTTDTDSIDLAPAPSGVYAASVGGIGGSFLTRYGSGGAQVWRNTLESSTRARHVKSDAAGNVYLGGEVYAELDGPLIGTGDALIRKYDASGVKIWGTQVGTPMYDRPVGMSVTDGGDLFVLNDPWPTNYAQPAPSLQTELYHFTPGGAQVGRTQVNPNNGDYPGNTSVGSTSLVRASTGEFYAAFSHFKILAPNTFGAQNYLAKLDAAGNAVWAKAIGGSNIMAMDRDASNNLVLASGSLTKFDGQGNVLWSDAPADVTFWSVCVNDDGRIFAGGRDSLGRPVIRQYASGGALEGSFALPLTGQKGEFTSLTISEHRLYGGAQIETGSTWSNNVIASFGYVPEPSAAASVALIIGACARRRTVDRAQR